MVRKIHFPSKRFIQSIVGTKEEVDILEDQYMRGAYTPECLRGMIDDEEEEDVGMDSDRGTCIAF